MNIEEQEIVVQIKEGRTLAVTKFYPINSIGKTLIVSSATGVLRRFYGVFANYFATLGFTVYTFDYWGIGDSGGSVIQLKKNTTDLTQWGSIDQSAITAYAKNEYPKNELIVIAHSIGGQITGFNTNYQFIDKLILVASQNGNWTYFKGLDKPKMWIFWYLLVPILTKLFGFFPAKKLGLFENLPERMALQWAHWGRRKSYLMHDYHRDRYFFERMQVPLLSFSFPKDKFAPVGAVNWLTEQFTGCDKSRVHYIPKPIEPKGIGHFGFFRTAYSDTLWHTVQEWINNT